MSDAFRIVAVLLLVVGNGIFVAAEYALVTARRTRLDDEAERGSASARVALALMDEPVRFISTVQIGITRLRDPRRCSGRAADLELLRPVHAALARRSCSRSRS